MSQAFFVSFFTTGISSRQQLGRPSSSRHGVMRNGAAGERESVCIVSSMVDRTDGGRASCGDGMMQVR